MKAECDIEHDNANYLEDERFIQIDGKLLHNHLSLLILQLETEG